MAVAVLVGNGILTSVFAAVVFRRAGDLGGLLYASPEADLPGPLLLWLELLVAFLLGVGVWLIWGPPEDARWILEWGASGLREGFDMAGAAPGPLGATAGQRRRADGVVEATLTFGSTLVRGLARAGYGPTREVRTGELRSRARHEVRWRFGLRARAVVVSEFRRVGVADGPGSQVFVVRESGDSPCPVISAHPTDAAALAQIAWEFDITLTPEPAAA